MLKSNFSEESLFYKTLFENELIGISISDGFNFIKVNDAMCKMLGYTCEEFLQKQIMDITVKDEDDHSEEDIEKLMRKELDHFTTIKKYRHKSEEIIYAETNVSGVYDSNRKYLMSIAIHQNITEQVLSNKKLKTSEKFFRGLFENSPVGITIGSIKNDSLDKVNSEFCKITGYTFEELKSISVKDITHIDDREKHLKSFEKLRNGEIDSFEVEKRYIHKTGKIIWANTSISTIRNLNGELISDFAIVEDITDRKKYEEKLKRNNSTLKKINKELDHFVYRTSHDLKAPLSSILGLINVARLDQKTDPYYILDAIESQIHRLELFIKDIIDYSRISRVENNFSKINFNELIDSALEDNAYISGYKTVDKSIIIEGDCDFYSDKNKIKIIFNNIISNAIKYYDAYKKESFLKINIYKTAKEAIIEVVDNGIGIKKDRISKLFTMFYRATDTKEGSGLGLFIIKEVLDSVDGKISIDSEYARGTSIHITIPNTPKI